MANTVLTVPMQGWACALDKVADAVFAERMLGDGIAIDPTGDTLHAPCAAEVIGVQPTGHAITLRSDAGAELLIHIGLDTVALDGRGFTPVVRVGDRVAAGDALIRFDLDLLVQEARAVITPILVTNGDRFAIEQRAEGLVAVGAPLMTLVARGEEVTTAASEGERRARDIVVPLAHGIHARPAARIAECAKGFDAEVLLEKDGRSSSVRSPIGVLTLGITHGSTVTVAATGAQAEAAVDAVAALILSGMGEGADTAAPAPAPAPPPPTPVAVEGALAGVTAAPGLAVGPVGWLRATDCDVPAEGCGIAAEEAAFDTARHDLATALTTRARIAHGAERAIVEAHAAMLDDPALLEATRHGIARGASAAAAWRAAIRPQGEALRATGDARLAERADDMRDLERQLIARLMGLETTAPVFAPGTILLADDLLPSQLLGLDTATIAGIAVERGGPTSHVAILAATLGLPALVAIGPALRDVAEGTRVILDASEALLHLDPPHERIAAAEARIAATAARRAEALARGHAPCHTQDGQRIEVFANLGSVADATLAMANGAEGSGLLRTEFLFLERETAPDVAEQTADYQAIADTLAGRPLIIRLLDIGGDKPAPYLPIPAEENPALGLRGIRVGLARPEILEDQLRAILSVRPVEQCKIMVPMIASLDELRQVRTVLDRLCAELGRTDRVPLGVMVETPAAAITADLLAREADFLSIGTNDLTQYALAMDRGNASVASALDGLHPAVLRLIGETCRGGAAHGRWTGVCGGLASDPLAVPILIGLGVTELSAAPAVVPDIKALVAGLTLPAARAHAQAALACSSAAQVRRLAREFAA